MKRIIKGNPPSELRKWFREQNGINCSYEDMPSPLKASLKERLVNEQGHLCCYTGKRVEMSSSHIEHLKPQSLSRSEGNNDDVEYSNMFAAYPKEDKPPCQFGAKKRGNWYDENLFIHPLCPDCEERFVYNFNGEIKPRDDNDVAAKTTIEKLGLDHEHLIADRKAAIDELFFANELSEAKARRLQEQIEQKNAKGQFMQFCFVLAQACNEYIRRLEKKRAKRLAIQRQRD